MRVEKRKTFISAAFLDSNVPQRAFYYQATTQIPKGLYTDAGIKQGTFKSPDISFNHQAVFKLFLMEQSSFLTRLNFTINFFKH